MEGIMRRIIPRHCFYHDFFSFIDDSNFLSRRIHRGWKKLTTAAHLCGRLAENVDQSRPASPGWRSLGAASPSAQHALTRTHMYRRASLLFLIALCSCYAFCSQIGDAHDILVGNFAADAVKVYVGLTVNVTCVPMLN